MDPPYAITIDKKLGTIYFSETANLFKPIDVRNNTAFSFNDANAYREECVKRKSAMKLEVTALDESLILKRKSHVGKKPPYKQIKYSSIKDNYQFSQTGSLIILALEIPKKSRQYIALDIQNSAKARTLINILQYASVAPNKNIKNPLPRLSLTPQKISTVIKTMDPKIDISGIRLTLTPDKESSVDLQTPSNPPSSEKSFKSSPKSLSFGSNSDKSSPPSLPALSTPLNNLSQIEESYDYRSNSEPLLKTLKLASSQSIISTLTTSHVELSTNFPKCLCNKADPHNLVTTATSPVMFNKFPIKYPSSSENIESETTHSLMKPTNEHSHRNSQREILYPKENKPRQIPIVVVRNEKPRDHSSSSSSSLLSLARESTRVGGRLQTLPNKEKNLFILASGKFHPFSVIGNERLGDQSACERCYICGKSEQVETCRVNIIKTDRNGEAHISDEGTVFMYSKTEKPETIDRVMEERYASERVFEKVFTSQSYHERRYSSSSSTSDIHDLSSRHGITFLK